jgi:transcriptional regulator with XRE-family HTH domain
MQRRYQVGARLRSLREGKDFSQEHFGELVGIDRKSVNRYEVGSRAMNIDRAHVLADALDAPVSWLFSDDWTRPDGSGDIPGEGGGGRGG